MLYSHLFKKYVYTNANLDNYDGLTDPRKHNQNIRSILELDIKELRHVQGSSNNFLWIF